MNNILKYQNPSSPLLIQRVNKSNANFVKRLLDPNRKSIPDWESKGRQIATHKLGWAEDELGAYVYPEVQEIDGQLIDFTRPPYAPGIADYIAHENNNIIRMSPEEADWFTRNYKQYYPSFKKGGDIHIKKKNRGKFTEYCGGKVTEECIAKGKKSKDPKIRKRATFAANARKWKHESGGILKAQNGINMYPVYGSQQKAKFAYDAGSRNPEAIGAAIPTRIGLDGSVESGNIKNTNFTTITNNGSSNTNFESKSTISYNDGLYNTSHVGNSNNNGVINNFEHHSFGMPNGDRYHTYNNNGVRSDRYEVDYAKRLGMDKLPKPKTLFKEGRKL